MFPRRAQTLIAAVSAAAVIAVAGPPAVAGEPPVKDDGRAAAPHAKRVVGKADQPSRACVRLRRCRG